MKSGRAFPERVGLVTKGPAFEKISRKSSSVFEEDKSESLVYENTYRMAPDESKRFLPARVKAISSTVLQEMLFNVDYDPKACRELSLKISDVIVRQVTSLGFDRYKIVCLTTIGQKTDQTVRIASQCCWDPKVDNFAESIFMNKSLFAVTVVYGSYQE
ncbi:tctex1 domain-containing protein 1-A-like [Actinia tenebrosa]|uniref:Tctex1 domain-containing protein 1-A-like n=1 Tax=Actinia tenebrosa TaxID=6105 RepID=A0A6P8I5F7_ACTTE|nr:tctex1 domain-containing protein 1-A-like [Actinia tenebrosa]